MVEKEIWAYILAYNLVVASIFEASLQAGIPANEISFKLAMQTIKNFQCIFIHPQWQEDKNSTTSAIALINTIFKQVNACRIGKRPGRVEPRELKMRSKKQYKLMMQPRAVLKKKLMGTKKAA